MNKTLLIQSEAKPKTESTKPLLIQLKFANGEFVTHVKTTDDGGCHWGHYFSLGEWDKARADYMARCKEYHVANNLNQPEVINAIASFFR